MIKEKKTANSYPSFFVRFKDDVVLPADLMKESRAPVLKAIIEGEESLIEPWSGDILFDVSESSVIYNDGEAKLINLERNREWDRDRLSWGNYFVDIQYDTYSFLTDKCERVYVVDADMYKSANCDTDLPDNQRSELITLAANMLSAGSLSQGVSFRKKNPNSRLIKLNSLADVILKVGVL